MSGCPLITLFQHILRDFSCFYQLDHILWTYLLLTTYQDYLLSICKYFISSLFDMATKPVLSFWLILKTLRFRAVIPRSLDSQKRKSSVFFIGSLNPWIL